MQLLLAHHRPDPIPLRGLPFRAFSTSQVRAQLERVAKGEGVRVDPDAYEAIIVASAGDLRRAINILQLTATFANPVTLETVRRCTTTPLRDEIKEMLELALRPNFLEARDRLYRLFTERGASGEDILRAIHAYVPDLPDSVVTPEQKVEIVEFLGEVDFRLAMGASERLQMETILVEDRRPTGGSEVKGWPGNVP